MNNEELQRFKELSLLDKEKTVLNELKTLSVTSKMMCDSVDAKNDVIINKELADVRGEEFSSDDFAEAAFVLIKSIEQSFLAFHEANISILENLLNNNEK